MSYSYNQRKKAKKRLKKAALSRKIVKPAYYAK